MSETRQNETHRRPHTAPMAEPFMEFDLPAEIDGLKAEATCQEEMQSEPKPA